MKVLLITYDLRGPVNNYTQFYDTIKKTAQRWWHYLDHTWLIATDQTPQQWLTWLQPTIKKSDRILIIEVKSNYYGLLSKEAWEWIQKNVGG